jgi:hypothetical protein
MSNVIGIIPRTVKGFPVEVYESEIGGLEVVIWRSPSRDDGFCFYANDRRHARHILREIERCPVPVVNA